MVDSRFVENVRTRFLADFLSLPPLLGFDAAVIVPAKPTYHRQVYSRSVRVHVEAYGCTLNKGEARMMAETLREGGHVVVADADSADANLLVTCTVIDYTERRMISRMKALAGTGKPLIVSGCMATAQPAIVNEVAPKAALVPPSDLARLSEVFGRTQTGWREEATSIEPPDSSVEAIVPIAQGCIGRCTYCITKLARGGLRSRQKEDILRQVERHLSAGYKEVWLTAQDSTAYGRDIGPTLADLINSVAGVEGDFRIRVGMASPQTCLPIFNGLVKAYSSPKVYKFLHLPVQSGDDEVLEAMGRGYTVDDFKRIVAGFREAFPDITVSTDIIVGFPGETERQFEASMNLLREVKPDIVNVTRFSSRPGTRAETMAGKVVGWRAKEWSRRMTALRFQISREINKAYEGRVLDAMTTERGKNKTTLARTLNYKQLVIKSGLPLGRMIRAKVVEGREVDLIAEVVET
jgi:threonylcarbamoyladenosine tRNA methylthiotransferase CDKAL1